MDGVAPDRVHDDAQEPHLTDEERKDWDRKVAAGDVLGEPSEEVRQAVRDLEGDVESDD